jgi:hypothetical protein
MLWSFMSFDEFSSTAEMYTLLQGAAVPAGYTLLSSGGVNGGKCLQMAGGNGNLSNNVNTTGNGSDTAGFGCWVKTNVGYSFSGSGFLFGEYSFFSSSVQPIVQIASTGGIVLWDIPCFPATTSPNINLGTFTGPGGKIVTDGKWHFIEVGFTGIVAGPPVMNLYVDGVLWHSASLSAGAGNYTHSNFWIGNGGANAGSTQTIDDFIYWDISQQSSSSDFGVGRTLPLNPGGGITQVTMLPTGDGGFAPSTNKFTLVGGSGTSLFSSVDSLYASNTPTPASGYGSTPASYTSVPTGSVYGGSVTFTPPVLPGTIVAAVDVAAWYNPSQPSGVANLAPYGYNPTGAALAWFPARSVWATVPASTSGSINWLMNPMKTEPVAGAAWTASNLGTSPSLWGLYNPGSGSGAIVGPQTTMYWSRTVLLAQSLASGKYVVNVICC